MPSHLPDTPWDFSPVYDLINSLSHKYDSSLTEPREATPLQQTQSNAPASLNSDKTVSFEGLGNFNKVWDFLGVTRDVPSPSIATFETSIATKKSNGDAYASDGALYYPPSSKDIWWHDSAESTDHAETQEDDEHIKKLTKTQRKKANRQARKRAARTEEDAQLEREILLTISDAKDVKRIDVTAMSQEDKDMWRKHLDKKHRAVEDDEESPSGLETGVDSKKLENRMPQVDISTLMQIPKYHERTHMKKKDATTARELRPPQISPANPVRGSLNDFETISLAVNAVQNSLKKAWPISNPFQAHLEGSSYHHRGNRQILPLRPSTSLDRNWSLLNKLLHNFPEDRNYLLSPLQLSINRPQPNGIHVFVDASNILIGFQDHLKHARGIPVHTHVGRIDLAFHSLALLLERRRPIAKRVLAGSTPEIPAFEEARQVGYETNILDKVLKAKELTDRQKKFATRERFRQAANGFSTGDETDNPYGMNAATPKWVEQAVDEILHLKMMESIVDVASSRVTESISNSNVSFTSQHNPTAPTMVLATGDAAEAEYSEGFMKQVERALKSGWNVEIVAWSTNISQAYRKWQKIGKENFKVIELDDYAEELFGTSE